MPWIFFTCIDNIIGLNIIVKLIIFTKLVNWVVVLEYPFIILVDIATF